MAAIKALLFDLDETLLEGGGNQRAILRACEDLAALLPGTEVARLQAENARVWQAYWPEVERPWTLGHLDTPSLGLEAWRRTLLACGCDDPALAEIARDASWRYQCEGFRLFDDVAPLLERLQGLPLALITNGASDLQREKLRLLDLESYFGAIVISGEAGAAKPEAAVFRAALDRLGVAPDEAWHIGDNLVSDVGGALAVGLTAVWLNRHAVSLRPGDPAPDHEVRSLAELEALLAAAT